MHNTIFINHIVNPRQTTLIMMPAAVLAATIKYCGWLVLPLSSIPTWCASCWNKKLNNFRWANFLFDSYIPSMCHSRHQKQHLVPNLISIASPLKRSKWTKNSWHFVNLHNEHLQKRIICIKGWLSNVPKLGICINLCLLVSNVIELISHKNEIPQ